MQTDARTRPTLAAIAREANVSIATVSKVLNGRPDVSATTRTRVERLLDARGYRRHRRQPSTTAPLIEVIIESVGNSWAAAVLDGVERTCHEFGIGMVVSAPRPAASGRRDGWLDRALSRGPLGVLVCLVDLAPAYRARLKRMGLPYVVVDPITLPSDDVPSVGTTNWSGGFAATEHLISLGHKRIAVITGLPEMLYSRARSDGYRTAMARAGLDIRRGYVRHADSNTHDGRREMLALLDLAQPPTAVFACTDPIALGAYRALHERSVDVPGEMSVVGFDDRPESHWTTPRLTTVRQPLEDMGATAVEVLMQTVNGTPPRTHRVELSTSLIVRDSTAPPTR